MTFDQLHTLFFGMTGATSATALEALLAAGTNICAVVIGAHGAQDDAPITPLRPPQGASLVPIANPFLERNIAHIAWERGLPAFALHRPGDPAALAALGALGADVACVACFPHRFPAALLALPPRGFLNMHPALLPAHRGPAPLFWVLRTGDRPGVTIHFMDEGLDTGDIAAYSPLDLPDGTSGADMERRSAALGGRLLAETLRALAAGTLARRPQPPGGSYDPWPTDDDFRISADWPARRAFNFMRGTAEWGRPYPVDVGGETLALGAALSYDPDATLPAQYVREGDAVAIQCAPGVLRAREWR